MRTPYLTPGRPGRTRSALVPAAVAPGDPAGLHVTLDDTRFSNANGSEPVQAVSAAEAYLDLAPGQAGATPMALLADDGLFDSTIEAAGVSLDTSALAMGRHMVYVRGQDAGGDWGPLSAIFLYVLDPDSAPFLEGVVREAGTRRRSPRR